MTDIEALRADVIKNLEDSKGGAALNQTSAGHLAMFFNKIAPADMAIDPFEYSDETRLERFQRLVDELREDESDD